MPAITSSVVYASDWTTITNMSQLKYQVINNRVYLRNMDDFDPTWLGCCYAYYVDLATDSGKATWAAMLSKAATGGKYSLGVNDKTLSDSPITYSGYW